MEGALLEGNQENIQKKILIHPTSKKAEDSLLYPANNLWKF